MCNWLEKGENRKDGMEKEPWREGKEKVNTFKTDGEENIAE